MTMVKQISHRDDSKLMEVDFIDDVRLFSFSSMKLTWVLGLSPLSVRLDVSCQNIVKLAYLLESSTVVPVENIFHILSSVANNSVKNDL